MNDNKVTIRSLLIGVLFSGIFAYVTVIRESISPYTFLTSTQIAVLPYVLLMAMVMMINPIIRLVRVARRFSPAEIMVVFIMGAVSSGISTFGMVSQLIPAVSGLHNSSWNNSQNRWDRYVVPYVAEGYFVSPEGSRAASARVRDAEIAYEKARDVRVAAAGLVTTRRSVAESRLALERTVQITNLTERTMRQQVIKKDLQVTTRSYSQLANEWKKYADKYDAEQVFETYQAKVEDLRVEMDLRKSELAAVESNTFARIDTFRRGLPEDLRAVPGFVYIPSEGCAAYAARVERLVKGLGALSALRKADGELTKVMQAAAGSSKDALIAHLSSAIQDLESVAAIPSMSARQDKISLDLESVRAELESENTILADLSKTRRSASAGQISGLDRAISRAQRAAKRLTERRDKLSKEMDTVIKPQLRIAERVATNAVQLAAIRDTITQSGPGAYAAAQTDLRACMDRFASFDASFRRFVVGDIEWKIWVRPLLRWTLLIFLTYVVLMAFNVLIFRQWAYNEKLIYPLAELPMILAGVDEKSDSWIPSVFKSGLFWAGASLSFGILGWNLLIERQLIPGVSKIDMYHLWEPYLTGSFLQGLIPSAKFHVFFTLIGVSFLIPSSISGSLWGFQIFYMIQLLLLVWLGYGVNEKSFPWDWMTVLNFRTAEGGGALLVFASVVMWKCKKYLFCAFRPASTLGLPDDERRELGVSSWLFILGSLALIGIITWGMGAPLAYTVLVYVIILIITIGLVRAVTEGGLLGFQCWFSPFHFMRSVFGMDKAWTAPSFMVPLMVYYSMLFLDIKTFIAPAMANALKVRDDLKMRRWRFHLAVAAGIVCAFVVSIAVHIILGYKQGADRMEPWFYTSYPPHFFNQIKAMAINPVDTAGGRYWIMAGAALMASLLYFRKRAFWLPHPIGFIMLVNPIMQTYWGSIFIGWVCKTLVNKYGNKDTYAKMRPLFLGLIAGELLICLFGANLNRN